MMHAINPPNCAIPGISQGILTEGGRLLFLSGHVPLGPDGAIGGANVAAQLSQVFANLSETLAAAQATLADIARLTIYVRDYTPGLLPEIRAVRDRWVNSRCPPASALIGVAALFHPDVLVEVDAVALLPTR